MTGKGGGEREREGERERGREREGGREGERERKKELVSNGQSAASERSYQGETI